MIATCPCPQKHVWMHSDFSWPHNTLLWEVLQLPQFVHNLSYVQWLDVTCLLLFCVFDCVRLSLWLWRLPMRFWWDKPRTNFHSKFTLATLANEPSGKLVRFGQTIQISTKAPAFPIKIPTKHANLLQHQIQFSVPDHSVSLGLPCNLRVLWDQKQNDEIIPKCTPQEKGFQSLLICTCNRRRLTTLV